MRTLYTILITCLLSLIFVNIVHAQWVQTNGLAISELTPTQGNASQSPSNATMKSGKVKGKNNSVNEQLISNPRNTLHNLTPISLPISGTSSQWEWVPTGNMISPRSYHTATLLRDGKVLIIGDALSSDAEVFDPCSGSFIAVGNTIYMHGYGHTATLLQDGRVLIAGGSDAQKNAEIFDPVTGIFSSIDNMYTEHTYHTATLLQDGRVLIAGGENSDSSQTHNKVELYDPLQNIFFLTDSLREDRRLHEAVLLPNGKVLIVGGMKTTIPHYGIFLASAEIFDPMNGTFRFTGRMNYPRSGHTVTLLGDRSVLVTGDFVATSSAEIFNIATGQFSLTANMTTKRCQHTATLMYNGRVLIAGGYVALGPVTTSSAEIYDPVKKVFTAISNMSEPRHMHTAVRLSDGRILVAGGFVYNSETWSAEIYSLPGINCHTPVLTSIDDVPYDQGGKVTLYWAATYLDTNTTTLPCYSIWRSISEIPEGAMNAKSTPVITSDFNGPAYRATTFNGKEYAWEWIANQPAHRFTNYSYTAPTLFDSMSTTNGMHYFLVSAQTNDPNVFYDSNIEGGYSVDNLSPLAPRNLAHAIRSDTVALHWNSNTETDMRRYAIYRSADSIIKYTLLKPYATTEDTIFMDSSPLQSALYFIRAQDIHDNYSKASDEIRIVISGVSDRENEIPTTYTLGQNYPNPFNPTTTINYQLPTQSHVTLKVFDVLGREVATLVNRVEEPGYKSISWDAQSVPSGVYFYRLQTNSFIETKKLLLLR